MSGKSVMSDEERLALATKLDKELNDFINGLEKRRYSEGWPEDRWQEEMEKHPFFMNKLPEPGDEISPLMEGIQQLKYDPNENTSEELALSYKDDGNFYMKHKKYRMSILSYTEGLKTKCENNDLMAILYNNRSAANYFLKNYRSALVDSQNALELKPDYSKAKWRAAQCANHLDRFELCIEICDQILNDDPENKPAMELRKSCMDRRVIWERDVRKKAHDAKRQTDQLRKTLMEIEKRGIKFEEHRLDDKEGKITPSMIQPKLGPLEDFPVKADMKSGELSWPVAFCYPEFLLSDFKQQLNENVTMTEYLSDMLQEPFDCDKEKKYRPDNVNVYYENRKAAKVFPVDLRKTVKDIIQEKTFLVSGGCLTFYVVPKKSKIEEEYLKQPRNLLPCF